MDGARPSRNAIVVVCPSCGGPASFVHANSLWLRSNDALRRAKALRDLTVIDDTLSAPFALYRHGLGARPIDSLEELTEKERALLRAGSPRAPHDTEGSCLCERCGYRHKHRLDWPREAYFQIEHRGHALWAWNRALALVLADYVSAPEKVSLVRSPYGDFLKRVPTVFLTAKAREPVVKKLRRKIEEATA